VRRRLLFILPGLVFLALAAAFYVGLDRDPNLVPSALIGKPVPQFALPALLDGGAGLKSADLKGRVVLVNVFASWCVPCRAEHPLLMRLAKEGIELDGIDYKDKPENATLWLDNLGDPYKRIGADLGGTAALDWGVYGVPETFVIDRTGTIRFKQVGPLSAAVINNTIMPLVRRLAK
jgi:cytochrome c biogenesis protein CcmG/thiol:disulfide interchange protein DsbE